MRTRRGLVKTSWRKSWVYENIHGHNGDGSGSKRMLAPDERSVWDDYLDLATPPNTPIAGQVCYSREIGFSPLQLSTILKTPVDVIERANKRMMELQMISLDNNGVVIINNWKAYQSDYERQKGYRKRLQEGVTPTGDSKGGRSKPLSISTSISISTIKDIFNYWNSKSIYSHKSVENHKTAIEKAIRIKGYTPDEVKQAISNYAMILKSDRYRWTYRWVLSDFLNRGLERFMDGKIAKQNFLRNEYTEESDDLKSLRHFGKDRK